MPWQPRPLSRNLMSLFDFFRQSKQLSDLRQEVDAMRKEWKAVQDEWDDWFDRFRRLHARIARRQQRDEAGNGVREDATEGAEVTTGASNGGLSASQLSANERILARRARLNRRGGE